jgi:hypothetical protein
MTTTENIEAAKSLRALAVDADRRAQESFDRSDTDGFLSQWASGLTAQKYWKEAEIVEAGGRAEFPALFDLDGNLVAAKLLHTRYGMAWGVLESDDPHSRVAQWVNRSYATKAATRNRNMRQKGYSEGRVLAPARAAIMGSGTGLSGAASAYVGIERIDGGFSRNVEVLRTTEVGDF